MASDPGRDALPERRARRSGRRRPRARRRDPTGSGAGAGASPRPWPRSRRPGGRRSRGRRRRRRRRPGTRAVTARRSGPRRCARRTRRPSPRAGRAPARTRPGRHAPAGSPGPGRRAARTAAASPAQPTSLPPPQSPEISPSASRRADRPSGATPAAVDPCAADDHDAPAAVRPGPQRAERVVADDGPLGETPLARGRPSSARTSRAVSAPASAYDADGRAGHRPRPARDVCRTSSASRSIPTSRPTAWCEVVGPRTAASSRPSSSTSATSVFEFPPSTARTVLTRARPCGRSRSAVAQARR